MRKQINYYVTKYTVETNIRRKLQIITNAEANLYPAEFYKFKKLINYENN